MRLGSNWNRRTFLGSLTAAAGSLLAPNKLFAGKSASSAKMKVSGFGQSGNPYQELGVKTVINCEGTMTVLGGSILRPELEAVMGQAGRHFVRIVDLEVAAGNRVAQMLKLPDDYTALVTSGAAAAMESGLAGILTGNNEQFIKQIPDLTGMKSEVIIQKSHRNPFDHQLRNTGIKLVVIETRDEFRQAVNEKTAMMHFSNFANAAGQIKVDEWIKLGKEYKIPCMNDAAADTPPVSHLWDYANMGYDLITFSGGKAMRGPQCAGLLIGRKELVANALLNNSPHEDTIGRSQKVGKEEIVGMVKALELYLNEDHEALWKEWQNQLDYISQKISSVPGVSTSFFVPDIANHVPHMAITWDAARIALAPQDASKLLLETDPSIVIGSGEDRPGLVMNSFMLQDGEYKIVADQLSRVFREHSAGGK
ncbi:MAG TPA: aminotransferase class V-fold PLP-dependent enzyme [Terriglobales bacterium]|jgi:L-seryl-tRNA(Ser) seleniumtransferase|nr:aminotransferase class V-fold PLP-dependent enzyme [Terriglobales bacterium]